MRIEITNLALMESIELDLTLEQSERLEKVLVNGNFYIKKLEDVKHKPFSTEKCMDINAKRGHIVFVSEWSSQNGTDYDIKKVKAHLVIGKVYEIATIEVHGWSTDVTLKGVEGIIFNAANFEDYFVDNE